MSCVMLRHGVIPAVLNVIVRPVDVKSFEQPTYFLGRKADVSAAVKAEVSIPSLLHTVEIKSAEKVRFFTSAMRLGVCQCGF